MSKNAMSCIHCGDPVSIKCESCPSVTAFDSCRDCHNELVHGKILKVSLHFTSGHGSSIPGSERNYDGGRFHSGEW